MKRIDSQPVHSWEWLPKGIFLSYTKFLNNHHSKGCPLAFSGIIATLKTIRRRFKENVDSLENVEIESFTKALIKTKKPSNLTYRNFVATEGKTENVGSFPQVLTHRFLLCCKTVLTQFQIKLSNPITANVLPAREEVTPSLRFWNNIPSIVLVSSSPAHNWNGNTNIQQF